MSDNELLELATDHAAELLAHIERLQKVKENLIQQAEIQAQEARTQRAIVMEIGQLVGCENDWETAGAVKGRIELLETLVYNAVSYR